MNKYNNNNNNNNDDNNSFIKNNNQGVCFKTLPGFYVHLFSLVSQSSGTVWRGRCAWVLIPYPILPPSLISHTVSVDVIKVSVSELRSCVNREVGLAVIPCPILPTSLISHTVFVDVKHRERRQFRYWRIQMCSSAPVSHTALSNIEHELNCMRTSREKQD